MGQWFSCCPFGISSRRWFWCDFTSECLLGFDFLMISWWIAREMCSDWFTDLSLEISGYVSGLYTFGWFAVVVVSGALFSWFICILLGNAVSKGSAKPIFVESVCRIMCIVVILVESWRRCSYRFILCRMHLLKLQHSVVSIWPWYLLVLFFIKVLCYWWFCAYRFTCY